MSGDTTILWRKGPARFLRKSLPALLALIASTADAGAVERHPLDPLSAQEIAEAVSIIAAQGQAGRRTRAAIVTLKEPDKAQVLRWRAGDPVARKAFAVLRVKGETIEAVVDLGSRTL